MERNNFASHRKETVTAAQNLFFVFVRLFQKNYLFLLATNK